MRSPLWTLPPLLLLLAMFVAACGGSDDTPSARSAEVPTATLPGTLPDPIIVSGTPRPASGQRYTVQDGDSPSSIAEQFGISVDALIEANGIVDPAGLVIGQELIIPGVDGGPAATATAPPDGAEPTPEPTEPPSGQVYVVQAGDIPETIAAQFGITAEALMAANGITDPASLQIGQELIIPAAE